MMMSLLLRSRKRFEVENVVVVDEKVLEVKEEVMEVEEDVMEPEEVMYIKKKKNGRLRRLWRN